MSWQGLRKKTAEEGSSRLLSVIVARLESVLLKGSEVDAADERGITFFTMEVFFLFVWNIGRLFFVLGSNRFVSFNAIACKEFFFLRLPNIP
jgi:hypothetical protein